MKQYTFLQEVGILRKIERGARNFGNDAYDVACEDGTSAADQFKSAMKGKDRVKNVLRSIGNGIGAATSAEAGTIAHGLGLFTNGARKLRASLYLKNKRKQK